MKIEAIEITHHRLDLEPPSRLHGMGVNGGISMRLLYECAQTMAQLALGPAI